MSEEKKERDPMTYETWKTMNKIKRDMQELVKEKGTHGGSSLKYERNYSLEVGRIDNRESRPPMTIDAWDVLTCVFAALFFMLPWIVPGTDVAYLFGIALLFSLVTRSVLTRIATLTFTATYFLLFLLAGWYFSLEEVFSFIFGINTITLVPVIVGTLMSICMMGSGVVYGLSGSTKYAGLFIIAGAFLISAVDSAVGYFFFAMEDWYILFATHLAIYITAFLIAWGIFYLAARLIRAGVLSAVR
ncbi:MAG: hypothetical protein HWN65_05545 [Candidatus Helarchaeota archaeon]|nr:hypothetical protein [Candidatus Helarchaeota archaeon]